MPVYGYTSARTNQRFGPYEIPSASGQLIAIALFYFPDGGTATATVERAYIIRATGATVTASEPEHSNTRSPNQSGASGTAETVNPTNSGNPFCYIGVGPEQTWTGGHYQFPRPQARYVTNAGEQTTLQTQAVSGTGILIAFGLRYSEGGGMATVDRVARRPREHGWSHRAAHKCNKVQAGTTPPTAHQYPHDRANWNVMSAARQAYLREHDTPLVLRAGAAAPITDSGELDALAAHTGSDAISDVGTSTAQASTTAAATGIGTPYAAGTGSDATTAATISMTTTAAINPGDTLFLAITVRTGTPVATTATFAGIQAPDEVISHPSATQTLGVIIARFYLASGLASGTTITATLDQSSSRRTVAAVGVPGVDNLAVDQVASSDAIANNPTTASPQATASAFALALWSVATTDGTSPGTPGTGWTALANVWAGTATWGLGFSEYQVLSTQQTITATKTFTGGQNGTSQILGVWDAIVAATSVEAITDSGTSSAAADFSQSTGGIAGGGAVTDSGTSSAVASYTAAAAIADSTTAVAAASQSGSEVASDAGTVSAAAAPSAASQGLVDQSTTSAAGVPSAASQGLVDQSTTSAAGSQLGSDAFADASTMVSAASQSGIESISDSSTVAAIGSPSAASQGFIDAQIASATAVQIGADAFADSGESDALAVHSGSQVDSGTSSGSASNTGAEAITDQTTSASVGSLTGADAIADAATATAAASAIGADAFADSGTMSAQVFNFTYGVTASDEFNRTVTATTSASWGTLDTGQTWTVLNTTSGQTYGVNGSQATNTAPAGTSARRGQTIPLDSVNQEVVAAFALDVMPTGASYVSSVWLRATDVNNLYGVDMLVTVGGNIQYRLRRIVGGAGTNIIAAVNVPGIGTYSAGSLVWVRGRIEGQTLSIKVWKDGTPEPSAWTAQVTDSVITSGSLAGVGGQMSSAQTNAQTQLIDHFSAQSIAEAAFEAIADTGESDATAAATGQDAIADEGTNTSTASVPTAVLTDVGESDSSAVQTGIEQFADQGTSSATAAPSAIEAFADQGTSSAAASQSGVGAQADVGTSASSASQPAPGESITDAGTISALASTPSPVEQDTDQGTSTSVASQTAAQAIVDQGTIVGTCTATTAAESPADSGISTGQSTGTGKDAIADAGTNTAAVDTQQTDLFTAGESDALAAHTASEAIADSGTSTSAASMPLAPVTDAGTISAQASNPGLSPLIADTFDRTVAAGGLGTTPDGHAWTNAFGSASWWSVTGGQAQIASTSTNSAAFVLDDDSTDVEVQFDFQVTQFAVGQTDTISVLARYTPFNAGNYIRAGVGIPSGGTSMVLSLSKIIGNVTTTMASGSTVIVAPVLNTSYTLKLRVVGFYVAAKLWQTGTSEPDWQRVAYLVPSDGILDGASGIRVQQVGGTTTPPIYTVDSFMVTPVYAIDAIAEYGTIHSGSASQSVTNESISDSGTNVAFGFAPLPDLNDTGEVDALAQASGIDAPYEIGTATATAALDGLANTPDSGVNLASESDSGTEQISDSGESDALAVTFGPSSADAGESDAAAVATGIGAVADSGECDAHATHDQSTGAVVESPIVAAQASFVADEQLSDQGASASVGLASGLDAGVDQGESDARGSFTAIDAPADAGTVAAAASSTAGDAPSEISTVTARAIPSGIGAVAENQITTSAASQRVVSESITDRGEVDALASTPVPFVGNVDAGTNTAAAAISGRDAKQDQGSVSSIAAISGTGVVAVLFDSGTSIAVAIASGVGAAGTDAGTVSARAISAASEAIVDSTVSVASASMPPVGISLTQSGTLLAIGLPAYAAAISDSTTSVAVAIPSGGFGWSDSGSIAATGIGSLVERIADSTIASAIGVPSIRESISDSTIAVAVAAPVGAPGFIDSGIVVSHSTVAGRDALAESDVLLALAQVSGFGAPSESPIVTGRAILSGQDAKQDHGTVQASASASYAFALADAGTATAIVALVGTFFYGDSGFQAATAAVSGSEKFIDAGRCIAVASASAIEAISAAGTVVAIGLPIGSQQFAQAGVAVAQAIVAGTPAIADRGESITLVMLTSDEALREVSSVVARAIISGDQLLADQGFAVARAIHAGQLSWPDSGINAATAIITGAFDFALIIKGVVALSDWVIAVVQLTDRLVSASAPSDSSLAPQLLDSAQAGVSTGDARAYTVSVTDS